MLQDRALSERVVRLPDLSRMSLRWLERHRVAIVLAVGLATVFVYRMVALRSQVALGIDAGNYLATMRQLFGTDLSGQGLQRPPLVGFALWPLAQLFGPLEATKILAVLASVLLGVPFYMLCSRFTSKAVAAAAVLPFVFSLGYMGALCWGFLTLIEVGLFTLCFCLIHDILAAPSFDKRKAIALALVSWALVGTNQIAAFVYVVTTLALGVVALAAGGRLRQGVLRLAPAALLAVVLSVPFLPIYLRQSNAVGSEKYLTIVNSLDGLAGGWENLRYFLLADPSALWAFTGVAGLTGAFILLRRSVVGGVVLLTLLLAPVAVSLVVAGEVSTRAAYFVYVPVWLGFAVCADALLRTPGDRRSGMAKVSVGVLAMLALLAALTMWRGHLGLLDSVEWYGYLRPEHVSAIEAVDRNAPPGPGVAYPRGLAWWTEGVAGRQTYEAGQRQIFTRAVQRTDSLIANALLAGERVTTNGSVFVADAYVAGNVPMDPVLGVDSGQLKHLLYLDDRLIEVEYGAGSSPRRVALADAASAESTTVVERGAFIDRRTYEMDGLRVVKEVTLPEQGERVTVTLSLDSAVGPLRRVLVPVQTAIPSWMVMPEPREALFGYRGSTHFADDWWSGVYVDVSSGQGQEDAVTLTLGDGYAMAEVRPESSEADVTLSFSFYGEPTGDAAGLRSFAAGDLIQRQGITFALVDRYPAKPWQGDPLDVTTLAWLEEGPYFAPLWEDGDVAAYLVAPAGPSGEDGN